MIPHFTQIAAWLASYGAELVVRVPAEIGQDEVFPAELALAATMGPQRKREFFSGRRAAREALLHAGGRAAAILQGLRGEPLWPDGFAGSITHTKGLVAAACLGQQASLDKKTRLGPEDVHQKKAQGAGIDLEEAGRVLSQAAWHHILSSADESALRGVEAALMRLVVFSAKESLYKAIYPVCGEFFGFEDASFLASSSGGTMCSGASLAICADRVASSGMASLRIERSLGGGAGDLARIPAGSIFSCRWQVDGDWLLTAVVAPDLVHDDP